MAGVVQQVMRRPQANLTVVEIFEERPGPSPADELIRALNREAGAADLRPRRFSDSALAVVVGSGPDVAALVETVFTWLSARPRRTAAVARGTDRIELPGPAPEGRQRLIEWLMERIEPGGPGDRMDN